MFVTISISQILDSASSREMTYSMPSMPARGKSKSDKFTNRPPGLRQWQLASIGYGRKILALSEVKSQRV
jgi:hypothetical protein